MNEKGQRIADDLADHLRNRIISGEFAPGTRLAEAGLASEYSVSRPTVRAALDMLTADGLLTREVRHQSRIPHITPDDVGDIVALLRVSEERALDHVLKETPDIRPLAAAVGASHDFFLQSFVELAGVERLSVVHRRSTFELLLFGAQQQVLDVDDGAERDLEPVHRQLVQAIVMGSDNARDVLRQLHAQRCQRLGVVHDGVESLS